jgi:leucyl aminopeptidase
VCVLVVLGRPVPAEAQIDEFVEGVNTDSLLVTVERLVAFETRFMGSDSNWAAVAYLEDRLASFGYQTARDTFDLELNRRFFNKDWFLSTVQANVLATKRGSLNPERKIVIGGHYDSISLDRTQAQQDVAPGADDNASGCAAVLEIARLLKDQNLDLTVEFAFWGAEEIGLNGSTHYARNAKNRGDQIELMIQIDAIGWPGSIHPDAFSIDTTAPNVEIAQVIADAARAYSTLRTDDGNGSDLRVTSVGCRCSDHQPFLDQGFPAVALFQFFDNLAPHLNMSNDTIGKVDINYVTQVTRAAIGGLLELAGIGVRSADFDGSGEVDFIDFVQFATRFNEIVLDEEAAAFDLDRDGRVGFSDFLIFADQFGPA